MQEQLNEEQSRAHWGETRGLMWFCLIVWAIFSFGIHYFVEQLNASAGGFPLGFYMASQGSLIVFVVLIFFFAWRQNAIDEKYGVQED